MSNIYITEPPTCGKVLLKTSFGDVDIELWSKEAPLACKNFVQLCLEGYFDGCPIHRIIKGFMVQTGDPSGTGTGGESVWGKPFKDELHGRIKFNHRGQVAMANEQKPNSNHSQFFVTLDACEWLNRKHTIFGKVAGVTMFNLLRMNDAEVDANERPVEVIKILSCEVLMNPFDDIVPRDVSARKRPTAGAESLDTANKPKKDASLRKGTKDMKLLSFGGDDEEAEGEEEGDGQGSAWKGKTMHSSHDSKFKDERLSSEVAEELQGILSKDLPLPGSASAPSSSSSSSSISSGAGGMRSAMLSKLKASIQRTGGRQGPAAQSVPREDEEDGEEWEDAVDEAEEAEMVKVGVAPAREKNSEFNEIRNALLRSKKAVKILTGVEADKVRRDEAKNDVLTPLERQRQQYLKRKTDHGDREQETLAKLMKFTASLKGKSVQSDPGTAPKGREGETYRGQVLQRDSDDDEDVNQKTWKDNKKLTFRSHIDDKFRGGDGRTASDYVVLDARDGKVAATATTKKHF